MILYMCFLNCGLLFVSIKRFSTCRKESDG